MIIELFGPPAAGKTTLAQALAKAIVKNGLPVHLIASSRPAECRSMQVESIRTLSWCRTALIAPLSRAAKLVTAIPLLLPRAQSDELTMSMMSLLPPRTLLWSVRYRRFLSQLSRSWDAASTSQQIVIFDQGFLNALCSMALLARSIDRNTIARGLALLPLPDLIIYVDAPRETLKARLLARLNSQGLMERFFEFDLQTSLRQIKTTHEVVQMLQNQGARCLNVRSLDRRLCDEAVERIVREVKWLNEQIDPVARSRDERLRFVQVAR